MENKYNDNPVLDDKILQEMALAYKSALKKLQNEPEPTIAPPQTLTTEQLLVLILSEVRQIKEQIAINKRIRLS